MYTALAALDRDLDLVLAADGMPPRAVLNDRLGRFHEAETQGFDTPAPISGLLVIDLDKDGRAVAEHNRMSGSCPLLFTWNGERFVCLGDFLGGGLGYLIAPGIDGQPNRDEAVAIPPDQLCAEGDDYRLAIVEPMDEMASWII